MNTAADINTTPAARGLHNSTLGCLFLGWLAMVQPIPGLGLLIGGPLVTVAIILSVVIMGKGQRGGMAFLIASLLATPVVWVIGLAFTSAWLGGK